MEDLKDIYFPHDASARWDAKCQALISRYGMAGYGMYWAIVEMLRKAERDGYKLSLQVQYIRTAIALQMNLDEEKANLFLTDCIDVFQLFATDGNSFWSESLLRRMRRREEIREKRRGSANKRWKNTSALHTHSKSKAVKKRKEEKSKDDLSPLIPLAFTSHPGFADAFDGFIESRKKQKPMTERALKLLVGKLQDLSEGNPAKAIKLLDQATERGWLTVFPLKEDHGNATRQAGNPGFETSTSRNARKASSVLAPFKAGPGDPANRDLFQDGGAGDSGGG